MSPLPRAAPLPCRTWTSPRSRRGPNSRPTSSALRVVRAVLPILRAQRCGHIVQLSSVAGLASWPMLGLYHAT
nr:MULTISPECIES: SDR family NAD(P)-dependent oxidoreductase [Streptomyces]